MTTLHLYGINIPNTTDTGKVDFFFLNDLTIFHLQDTPNTTAQVG